MGCPPYSIYLTLESRICDICPRVNEAIAIGALCLALVPWHWQFSRRNVTFRVFTKKLIDENKWRAACYELDCKIIEFGKQAELPGHSLKRELFKLIGEESAKLDS